MDGFGRIKHLIQPYENNVCVINLASVRHNYRKIASAVRCVVGAVVKADAYGFGLEEISLALYRDGCRDFWVASIDEGMRLRRKLEEYVCGDSCALSLDIRIFVLSGIYPGTREYFQRYGLIPVISSICQLENIDAGDVIVLHVDTGLCRTGVSCEEAIHLSCRNLNVHSIISHLACSDNPQNQFNEIQRLRFEHVTAYYPNVRRSLVASVGVGLGEAYHYDMVRIGRLLYGFSGGVDRGFLSVLEVYARIVRISFVSSGESIGYDALFVTQRDSVIATVHIGYSDGFLRAYRASGSVVINGHLARIVGMISMDYIMIDITDIQSDVNYVVVGDWVSICSSERTVDALAADVGTIAHEISCSVGGLLRRVYIGAE